MKRLDERILYNAGLAIDRLPRALVRTLAGGAVVRDGHELHPELALMLRVGEKAGAGTAPPASLEAYREEQRKSARIGGGPPIPIGDVRDLTIDGAEGPLRARLYRNDPAGERPEALAAAPLLVFFHGGGFVFGDLETHDAPCRYLCRHAGAHVLAVDYRLAPEHPFPAAALDARAALRWAIANAASLGADPARVGVVGDSAGGNLAAVTSLMAARDGGPAPACQILVYPAICRRTAWPSLETFADGFFLTHASVKWFHRQYVPSEAAGAPDPRLNPLAGGDHEGLPPALVVTAGFDPLRDEGEAYGDALARAGNEVTVRRFGGMFHGFFNMVGISRAAREAVVEIAGGARILLRRR